MHIAIVGAGALGSIYGARLADVARVTFVVRTVPAEPRPIVIERVDDGTALRVETPQRVVRVPSDADVVVVCVRVEQIDEGLADLLRPTSAPVVTMTPLLPQNHEFLLTALGKGRLVPGMPGIVGYRSNEAEERFRYWIPRVGQTLLERTSSVEPFARVLERAGIPCKLQERVYETNVATTLTFAPLTMGLDIAKSADELLRDGNLLDLVLDGVDESRKLAQRIGKPAVWANLLVRFASSSVFRRRALKMGLALARRSSPEAVAYVEDHFGRKLHAQHVRMCESLVELATRENTPHAALSRLCERLGPSRIA